MADNDESTPQKSQVSFLTSSSMSNKDYKNQIEELGIEMYNALTSLSVTNEENAKLVLRVKILETKNEYLELVEVKCLILNKRMNILENKIKCMTEIEAYLRKQIGDRL